MTVLLIVLVWISMIISTTMLYQQNQIVRKQNKVTIDLLRSKRNFENVLLERDELREQLEDSQRRLDNVFARYRELGDALDLERAAHVRTIDRTKARTVQLQESIDVLYAELTQAQRDNQTLTAHYTEQTTLLNQYREKLYSLINLGLTDPIETIEEASRG